MTTQKIRGDQQIMEGTLPLTVESLGGSPTIANADRIIFSGALVEDLGSGDVKVSFSGGGGGLTEGVADTLYLKLDTANNPLSDQLQIINDISGNGGIYVQTADDSYTADFEQLAYNDTHVFSPVMFAYRAPGDASATNFSEPMFIMRQDSGNGTAEGDYLNFVYGGSEITVFKVTSSGVMIGAGMESTNYDNSMILKSPNGNRWRVTVDNSGNLTTTAL